MNLNQDRNPYAKEILSTARPKVLPATHKNPRLQEGTQQGQIALSEIQARKRKHFFLHWAMNV